MKLQEKREALQWAIQICLDRSFDVVWPHDSQAVIREYAHKRQRSAGPGEG